ncbi:MAG: DUF6754 domain-containing protein [bacterium]
MKNVNYLIIVLILVAVLISGIFISARTKPADQISADVQAYQLSPQSVYVRINVPGISDGVAIEKIIIFSADQIDTFRDIKKTSIFFNLSSPSDSVEVTVKINHIQLILSAPVNPASVLIPDPPEVFNQPENAGNQIDLRFNFFDSPQHHLVYPDSFIIYRRAVSDSLQDINWQQVGSTVDTIYGDQVEDGVIYLYKLGAIYGDSVYFSNPSQPVSSSGLPVPPAVELTGNIKQLSYSENWQCLLEIKLPNAGHLLDLSSGKNYHQLEQAVPESMVVVKWSHSDSQLVNIQQLDPQIKDSVSSDIILLTDSDVSEAVNYRYQVRVYYSNGRILESETTPPLKFYRQWFAFKKLPMFIAGLLFSVGIIIFIKMAKSGKELFVRKINGINAVDEAIGRATEMGRDVLFIPGIMDMDDVQTIAGMIILGRVAKKVAQYESRISVPSIAPVAFNTAKEVVRQSFIEAGRPDSYDDNMVFYITGDQFGFAAAVDGIMVREKPATIFLMGHFYAESLIIAETGHSVGAIQIAGTADTSQLPFFVAACDYTLIGEEFFAASAYLSGDPQLIGSLKAQDIGKAIAIIAIIMGSILATFSINWIKLLFYTG